MQKPRVQIGPNFTVYQRLVLSTISWELALTCPSLFDGGWKGYFRTKTKQEPFVLPSITHHISITSFSCPYYPPQDLTAIMEGVLCGITMGSFIFTLKLVTHPWQLVFILRFSNYPTFSFLESFLIRRYWCYS